MKAFSLAILVALGLVSLGCSDDDKTPAAGASTGGSAGTSQGGAGGQASGGAAGASGGTAAGGQAGQGAGGAPDVVKVWDQYCVDLKKKATDCGLADPPQGCAPSACIAKVYASELIAPLAQCLLERTCDGLGGDDACIKQVTFPNGPPEALKAEYDACVDKHDTCVAQGFKYSDDNCDTALLPLIHPDIRAQAKECLARPCSEIPACLETVNEQFACFK